MQRQPTVKQQISKKSCGILYHLKRNLQKRNKTLENFICQHFGYRKQQFTKNEFQKLIKKYDQNLLYDEIDILFDQLDDCQNRRVFYYRLKQIYDLISQQDNPIDKSRNSLASKVISIFNFNPSLQQVIQQVKSILLSSEDIFQIIDLFAVQKTGYLSVQNVIQILKSFQYQSEKKRTILLQYLFENKNKISVDTFIEKLQLDSAGKRVDIKKLEKSKISQKQIVQDTIIDDLKSQFMKSKIRQSSRMEDSYNLDLDVRTLKSSQQFISFQKIPAPLQPYYNYGSVLQPEFGMLASQYIQSNQFFIDTENPTYSKAFQFVHIAQLTGDNYTLFKISQSVIRRDKNRKGLGQLLESKDIIQGALGDCYFMSAISAIVERYPELVYRLFVLDKNPSHLYGIRLFINGVWKTIIVDACFPIDKRGILCAAQPYKNQIWVLLLEKAWAKVFGSYDNIHAGYNQQGLNAIAGAPSIHASSRDAGFLKILQVHLKKGAIITCATSAQVQQMTDLQQDNLGIYSNHAYTLLSVFTNLPYKNGQVTLLKIRNPWGRKQWKGDWSYYSSMWSKQLKNLLDYNYNPQDGSFYMSYDNFIMYFDFVNICQVNLSYVNSNLTFQSQRNEWKVLRIKIKQKGDYFFTQYQQNPRKFKNSFNYQKSKSWMFLVQKNGETRSAIGSRTTQYRDNTLQATLTPGQYLLISKISWKYWQKHQYTLTSYGPDKVQMILDNSNKYNAINQISSYVQGKSKIGLGKMSGYDKINASKRIYMDAIQGYGFLEVNNFQDKVLKTEVSMNPCKGIYILPPYHLPMVLQVFPNQSVIVKFIVDPAGYAYQYGSHWLSLIGCSKTQIRFVSIVKIIHKTNIKSLIIEI